MNKKITIAILVIAAFCFIQSNCKKNNPDDGDGLPPLTFTGANTIGCKINGQPWVPKGIFGGGVAIYPTQGGYYVDPIFPGVHILIRTHSTDGIIDLFCRNYAGSGHLKPGTYILNRTTQRIIFGYGQIHNYGFYNVNGKEYFTDSLHTGKIEILKSDSINKIISGRFEFDAYNASDGKTYKITEGRFDYTNH